MASAYFRAMATCSMLQAQLEKETQARKAMELCFQKIHKSLDLYKGHYINRLRFHMNRHHTEYLRKVRAMQTKAADKKKKAPQPAGRRSERISHAEELSAELHNTKHLLKERDAQIETLCRMLDELEDALAKK